MKRSDAVTGARLGALALVLAAGAVVADFKRPSDIRVVSALQLARWIRDSPSGLDVVDVRDEAAFEAGHVPTARNVPADRFARFVAEPDATVVLYGDREDPTTELAAAVSPDGSVELYVLERGIAGWLDDVMAPRIADDASARERAAFAEQAELSRWFGGLPRVVPASALEARPAESSSDRTRRLLEGC